MADDDAPEVSDEAGLDRLDSEGGTITVRDDFDKGLDLDEIMAGLYTEEGRDQIYTQINQQLALEFGSDTTVDNIPLEALISRVAMQRHLYVGPEASDEFLEGIVAHGNDDILAAKSPSLEVGLPPRREFPIDADSAVHSIDGLEAYLLDTFGEDREMKRLISQVMPELLGGAQGLFDQIDMEAVDPNTMNPVAYMQLLKTKVAKADADKRANGTFFDKVTGDVGNPTNYPMFDAILEEYQSGRSDLPAGHSGRDPSGLITPVEEANNSKRLRNLDGSDGLTTKIIEFQDPNILFGIDDFSAKEMQAYQNMFSNPAYTQELDPAIRAGMLNDFTIASTERAINYAWELGSMSQQTINDPITGVARNLFNEDSVVHSKDIYSKSQQGKLQRELSDLLSGVSETPDEEQREGMWGGLLDIISGQVNEVKRQQILDSTDIDERLANQTLGAEVAYDYFYNMSDKDFRALQLGALNSGIVYPEGTTIDDIRFGDRTDNFAFKHWDNAIAESARQDLLGQKVDINTILDNASFTGEERRRRAIQDERDKLVSDRNASNQRIADINVFNNPDPLAIRDSADSWAQDLLGRRATEAERNLMVKAISAKQKSNHAEQVRAAQTAAAQTLGDQIKEAEKAIAEFEFERVENQIKSETIDDFEVLGAEGGGGSLFAPGSDALSGITQRIGERENRIQAEREQRGLNDEVSVDAGVGGGTGNGGSVIRETQAFDPNAWMRNYFKTNNNGEYKEHQMREVFDNFTGLLGQPIQGI